MAVMSAIKDLPRKHQQARGEATRCGFSRAARGVSGWRVCRIVGLLRSVRRDRALPMNGVAAMRRMTVRRLRH
jgi:hypothetical protein